MMLLSQLNLACASLTNINKVSLHTADPGNTGENDSGETKQTITWSTPAKGYMRGQVTFSSVSGTFTHIGLWDDNVFVYGRPLNVTLPTEQDLGVLVEFTVEATS